MRPCPRARPRRAHLTGGERGSYSLEIAVLFPVVLLMIFTTVQGALYFHARNVALSAAQDGVRAARAVNGSAGAGHAAAASFLSQAGGGDVITGSSISASRGAAQAAVTVSGSAPKVLGLIPSLHVSQTAKGPVERFTAPGGG